MSSFVTTPERYSPFNSEHSNFVKSPSCSDASFKINRQDTKMGSKRISGSKANHFACRIHEHVKLGHNLSETLKSKLSLGAAIIKEGGRENIFRHIFGMKEGEEMLKASQCYLHTTAGPIAGLLFISTEKVAFCSVRSITFHSPTGDLIRAPYKVLIPIKKIKEAYQSENLDKSEQKYIEIVTRDGYEFWFMGFLRYEKAFRNLEKAISMANQH